MPNPKESKALKMVKRFMPNCHYKKGKQWGNKKQGIFAPTLPLMSDSGVNLVRKSEPLAERSDWHMQ